MANEEHIKLLQRGVAAWNAYWKKRRKGRGAGADLRGADLGHAKLDGIDFNYADLTGARLPRANLKEAQFNFADLGRANLSGADLVRAGFRSANLIDARLIRTDLSRASLEDAVLVRANMSGCLLIGSDLRRADMRNTNLSNVSLRLANLSSANLAGANLTWVRLDSVNLAGAILRGVNLANAFLDEAIFADVDLSGAVGLEDCRHLGPSTIDHRTIQRSKLLPRGFLRGVGLPDVLIDFLPSLSEQAIQYFSCFISYSTTDEDFAVRIYHDLQDQGVRCWFAPHDMRIGGKILDEIDSAIRLRDRVLLILSTHSIKSDWVEDEVTRAFEEERRRRQTVLFPIRIDDAVMASDEAWAGKLRARHIGDFRSWNNLKAYQSAFRRVVRDLTRAPSALE